MKDKNKLARPELTEIILTMVKNERVRQDENLGVQSHNDGNWQFLLNKELGDFAKAKLSQSPKETRLRELVQAAAILIAWIEDEYDRTEKNLSKEQSQDPIEQSASP